MSKMPIHLLAWSRSAEFRRIARRQCQKMNAERARAPKCKATAKSTGDRCGNVAMANGTCWAHGGTTPKGMDWHRPRWPDGAAPDAVARADRKTADLQKRARQRKRRVAQMSPEERAEHDAWQAAHRPGNPAERARRRAERKAAADARRLVTGLDDPKPVSREQRALLDAIAVGETRLAELRHEAEMAENWTTGVFA